MISRIEGKIRQKKDNAVIVDIQGLCYEVFVPTTVMRFIEKNFSHNDTLSLVTFHYHQVDSSRSIPTLIGFLNEIEKEFFEQFISVSGVGPRTALKALTLPISKIAQAIDMGDVDLLSSLPGIGRQRAKEIIAKLQGRIGKYGLIQDKELLKEEKEKEDIKSEAIEVLLQLQYKKHEAEQMVKLALEGNPKISTTEELLNEVYRQRKRRDTEEPQRDRKNSMFQQL